MKQVIQAIMAVPISDTIGKTFGNNSLLATGATIVTARVVLRSFFGMVVLGALAGGIQYLQKKHAEEHYPKPADTASPAKDTSRHSHGDAEPASA
jgi:energy-converting hydrogenase Eha subunit A